MNINFSVPSHQLFNKDRDVLKNLISQVHCKNPLIAEIGSWTGESTSILANHAKRKNGIVISIDTWDGRGSILEETAKNKDIFSLFIKNMTACGVRGNIIPIHGNSSDVAAIIKDESIDFIFIDGDHRYSQVFKDIDLWIPKIKYGGIISGHDFDGKIFDEKHIEKDYVDCKHHGVIKAVLEKFDKVNTEKDSSIWWIRRG